MSQAKEQSIKEYVKAIAQKQGRTFNDVWQEVALERWLARLSKSKYRKNFIFKGAMCLLRYVELQRETRDLDFLIKNLKTSIGDIRKYLGEVAEIDLRDGFLFDTLQVNLLEHVHMQYPGFSASVIGHLGKTKTKIFINIGVGDAVKPTEITMRLLTTGKTPLFEKDIALWAYPIESIFAEKLETAVSRSDQNSRMKDYHDLLCLIRSELINNSLLKDAVAATFSNRDTTLRLIQIEENQLIKIQKYWEYYYRALITEVKNDLPEDFKKVVSEINQHSVRLNLIPKTKIHPWRMCPAGEHWVRTHPMRVPASRRHPAGSETTRHAHCAHNPSGKDQLYPDEIQEIANLHFRGLKDQPCPLPLKFKNGSQFDDFVAGWVQYWNEVLKPNQPLDPNLVKALIASESGFKATMLNNKSYSDSARGLMQITNETRKILGDEDGELKDHFITATKTDLNDPGINICAGVRWLFRKRDLASFRLKREATWVEAAEVYKGDLRGILNKSSKSLGDVKPFLGYLQDFQKCGK